MNSRIAIGAALAGAALFGAIAVAFSNAQSGAPDKAFDETQKEAIREIVHDYLMENPEILIDALNEYGERERANEQARTKASAKDNLAELLNEKDGFAIGADPAAAEVAVIELFDYHCPYCKRASEIVRKLAASDPAVRIILREYPILREESAYASMVALAARAQGKYEDLHFALMDASGVLTKERVKEIAESKGVNFSAIEKELNDPSISKAIDETHRIASEMEADGTPTFIVASTDGAFVEVVPGLNTDMLNAAIADAKKAAKTKN